MCLLFTGTLFNQLSAQYKIAYVCQETQLAANAQYTDALDSMGYDVDISSRWDGLSEESFAELETFDLVIFSRNCSNQSYGVGVDDPLNLRLDSLTTPVITQSSYFNLSSRGARVASNNNERSDTTIQVEMTSHPIFTNLLYGADSISNVLITAQFRHNAMNSVGNGTQLASCPSDGNFLIAEWDANTEPYDGYGVNLSKWMFWPQAHETDLTDEGLSLWLDIVEYMITGAVTDKSSPTAICLSDTSFAVNTPIGAVVGEFSATDPQDNIMSYALVEGDGDDNNDLFIIDGISLELNADLDADGDRLLDLADSNIVIRVEVTDSMGKTFSDSINLFITPYDDAPADIYLSNTSILENQDMGTVIGVLSAFDANGDIKMYELVEGDGDTDNESFYIDSDSLKSDTVFNYEVSNSYSIRVMVTDSMDQTTTKIFTVSIEDIDESPTEISIDTDSIEENLPIGTMVATISGIDPQDDIVSFELGDSVGNHNSWFYIDGDSLYTNAIFDYEFFDTLTVNIKAIDSEGSSMEKAFTIYVIDTEDLIEPTVNSQYKIAYCGTDTTYVELLTKNGYDVDLSTYCQSNTTEMADSIESTYDLVILGRNASSGSFNPDIWNPITTPVINMSAYVSRSSKACWINTIIVNKLDTTLIVKDPEHAIFTYVNSPNDTLTGLSNELYRSNPWVQGYGKLLAQISSEDVAIAEWKAGLPFYEGESTLAGRRMVFNASDAYNLTERGDSLFLDAVEYMITGAIGAPNEISIDVDTLTENMAIETTVDTLVALDRHGDVVSYELVDGEGSDENELFTLDGDVLKVAGNIDYETNSSISIRVQVVDADGNTFDEIIEFIIQDAPDAPYSINIDNSMVDELVEAGTFVGTLSALDDDKNATDFTLVAGDGDDDNTSFTIDSIFSDSYYEGLGLYTATVFDYETRANLTVRIQVTDASGLTFSDSIELTVIDINENPTDISYSGNKITENNEVGVVIGSLTAIDPQDDVASFALVSGDGDTDNDKVTIDGTDVLAAVIFDYESQVYISFRVQVVDIFGNSYEEVLYTSIMDDSTDNPTEPTVLQSVGDIEETEGFGTKEIDLSEIFGDEDGDTLTYEFIMSTDSVISLEVDNTNKKLTITEKYVGTVTVTLTAKDDDDNDVSDIFDVTIIEGATAINELSSNNILIYPNPSSTGVFKLKLANANEAKVVVNDMLGRVIAKTTLDNGQAEIDLSEMNAGYYIATIISNDQILIKKLIKE
jgi:hypothetical protein